MHMVLILWPLQTLILFVHFYEVPLLILTPSHRLASTKLTTFCRRILVHFLHPIMEIVITKLKCYWILYCIVVLYDVAYGMLKVSLLYGKCFHISVVEAKTDFSHNCRWRTAWWYLRILMDMEFYFSQLDVFVCWHMRAHTHTQHSTAQHSAA